MVGHDDPFERAVTAVVDGDVDGLQVLPRAYPALATARSHRAHRATLLHYVAANGVEDERQRCPPQAVTVCRALLAAGADPDARAATYDGGVDQTPLCLLVSSWHPFARGLQEQLVAALVRGGAAVDGTSGDGAPLAVALLFGYTGAAEALVACGARVDNLYFAAGLGDLPAVRGYFTAPGQPHSQALSSYRPPIAPRLPADAAGRVQEALHHAITHDRGAVALELLSVHGADPNGRVVGHHAELPLLQALFVRKHAMVRLLLAHGADADAVDGKRGVSARAVLAQDGPSGLLD